MSLRRFTQLTNGHGKRLKHHAALRAIVVAWYNFARPHESLKGRSPAMASELADKVWTIKQLLENATEH
jgi:transposase InsO family protein